MRNISEILKHEQELLQSSANIRKSFVTLSDLDSSKKVWFAIGNRLTDGKYKVDENLKEPITEILKWCIMDTTFKGDLQKGLLLSGEIGCGKTLTLKVFVEFMEYASKIVASYSAIEIVEIFRTREGKDRLFVSPLFIDDLGTEQTEINNFGVVFERNNGHGQAVRQGETMGGGYDVFYILIYSAGFTWDLMASLFDNTITPERVMDAVMIG